MYKNQLLIYTSIDVLDNSDLDTYVLFIIFFGFYFLEVGL